MDIAEIAKHIFESMWEAGLRPHGLETTVQLAVIVLCACMYDGLVRTIGAHAEPETRALARVAGFAVLCFDLVQHLQQHIWPQVSASGWI